MYVLEVPGQSAGIAELLAAHVAGEGSLVLVDPHVSQIRILQFEAPAALGAPVRFLSMRRFSKNLAQVFIVLLVIKYR